ncbi:MAG: TRAM domain-containing protein [Chlamydiales bacterium]|nr:TRAM domain-containing protein [Chlamydiales bacterium]
MTISTTFVRILFVILSVIFMITYAAGLQVEPTAGDFILGAVLGLIVGALLIGIDLLFKRFNLRSFNMAIVGLFIGYLMALALLVIFDAILDISGIHPRHFIVELIRIFIFLFGTYLGVIMTLRSASELYVSIPFIKLTPAATQTKDILLDTSALCDPRIIDLAASGLLDKHLILPRFVLKELHEQEEESDEGAAARAKRALEVVKKLETQPELGLRYQETDFPEVKESTDKVLRLARLLDASVLSADINRVQMAQVEGVRIINIHALSNALKPLMQRGELLRIKIQRHGKEDRQGVGYLEEGTMVVVNGGGDYIGETITAHVLSVKHTASGRMIFCNVAEDEEHGNRNILS